jgi:Uma2 family endonuclease
MESLSIEPAANSTIHFRWRFWVLICSIRRKGQGLITLISARVRTRATRIRVPDLAVIRASSPRERIITYPPLLAIEVRSWSDALRDLEAKSAEYLAFGIEHVWVVDPYARVGYRGTAQGVELVRTGELSIPGTPIRMVLDELFSELDRV